MGVLRSSLNGCPEKFWEVGRAGVVLHCGLAGFWAFVVALLVVGLILFIVPHLFRETGLRAVLLAQLPSEGAYKGLYSLLALAGLVLIAVGKGQSDFVMIWEPRFELRSISHVIMIPVFILIVAGNIPLSNLRKNLRNPMMLGTCLWGLAHLWSNGDLASILLFGSFTLWSGFKFVAMGLRQGSIQGRASVLWDGIALIAGLVLYGTIAIFHGQLFGVGLSFV
jgi:uncharacterized membrane protein